MKKILFTDFDETLMCTDKSVCEANRAALREMTEAGHYVVYTTGRARSGAEKVAESLKLPTKNAYLATFQGCVAYDLTTGREVFNNFMEQAPTIALINRLHEMGLHLHIFSDEVYFTFEETDAVARFDLISGVRHQVISSTDEIADSKIYKIMVIDYDNFEPLDALSKEAKNWNLPFEQFFSDRWYYEFCGQGQNKGTCLVNMSKFLNIPIENTVAVGDEENDSFMIKAAHVGCAMKNARPEIQATADYITQNDNNNGGVAEVIHKFILTD